MKNKIKSRISIICLIYACIIFMPTYSYAIDGYKNFKFGMNEKEILKMNPCSLQSETMQPHFTALQCTDFTFGGESVNGAFFFVDKELLRVAIFPSINKFTVILNQLKKKYGAPSSSSGQNSFKKLDQMPNQEAFLAFDKNTIYLKISSDETNIKSIILLYTSKKYDQKLLEQQQNSIEGDL
jgi:hypothetical protein